MSTTMAAQAASTTATAPKYGHPFFENLWRMSGVQAVAFFLVGSAIAGFVPGVGAFIAAPILGLATLNLLWFASAVRSSLADAGLDGWGASATAASSAFGAIAFLLIALHAGLAYSIAETAGATIASSLTDLGWAAFVLSSFPRAMLVMAGSFGLWRAAHISNRQFGAAVGLVILGVLGGTTWIAGGVWAPDGLFSAVILPALELAWIVAVSRVIARVPSTRNGF